MKHSLNRIEALNRLETATTTSKPRPAAKKRAYSFEIRRALQKQEMAEQTTSDFPNPNLSKGTSSSTGISLQPDSGKNRSAKIILPEFNFNRDSRGNKAANPALEMNQPQEIQTVAACESQLRQIVHQIENLYMEGPIVDGWLEFCTPASAPTVTIMHQDSVNHLINNGENGEEVIGFDSETATNDLSAVNYRLCGLDATGQKWAYPCPPDQLPSVSVAIARYHKLQQLLQQKQYLETRLKSINSN